jgi:hypothetical protein
MQMWHKRKQHNKQQLPIGRYSRTDKCDRIGHQEMCKVKDGIQLYRGMFMLQALVVQMGMNHDNTVHHMGMGEQMNTSHVANKQHGKKEFHYEANTFPQIRYKSNTFRWKNNSEEGKNADTSSLWETAIFLKIG